MNITINSLTHDELVSILSTATYGSDWLGITSNEECGAILPTNINEIKETFEKEHGTYCCEDKWADILLNGGTIVCLDYYDEDDNGEEGKEYPINLTAFLKGLGKAQTECPHNFSEVIKFDGSEDYYDANNVMQCIIFGELVYG